MSVERNIGISGRPVYDVIGDGISIIVRRSQDPEDYIKFPRSVIPLLTRVLQDVHRETEDLPDADDVADDNDDWLEDV